MRSSISRSSRPSSASALKQIATMTGGDNRTLDLDFTNGVIDSRVSFYRSTTGTFINSSGVLQTAAAGTHTSINQVARFDHDPITLTPRGLLIEDAATNVLTGITSGGWGRNNINGSGGGNSLAFGQTGPDQQSNTAARITTAASTSFTSMNIGIVTNGAGTVRTFSVWLRGVGANTTASIGIFGSNTPSGVQSNQFGSGVTVTTTTSGNNLFALVTGLSTTAWTRVSISRTDSQVSSDSYRIVPGNHTATIASGLSIDVYGPQAESGFVMSSTILTTTAQVTRDADIVEMDVATLLGNGTGTLVARGTTRLVGDYVCLASLNDGSPDNSVEVGAESNEGRLIIVADGSEEVNTTCGTVTANKSYCVAGAYATNDAQVSCNGALGSRATPTNAPDNVGVLFIGMNTTQNVVMNGTIERIIYFPTLLSDAALQQLTT